MIAPRHILGTFDEALTSLRNDLLMMSGLAERSLDRAIKGLLQRDDDFYKSKGTTDGGLHYRKVWIIFSDAAADRLAILNKH